MVSTRPADARLVAIGRDLDRLHDVRRPTKAQRLKMDRLTTEALRTPARTVAGLAAKARIALAHSPTEERLAELDLHERFWRSLTDDAAALSTPAGA